MNQEIIQYIKKRFSEGGRESDIIDELKNSGWKIPDINIALAETKGVLVKKNLIGPPELLKGAWSVYRNKFFSFISIALPLFIINIISQIFLFNLPQDEKELGIYIIENFEKNWAYIIPLFILWFIVSIFVSIWIQVVLLYVISREEEDIKPIIAYKKSLRLIPSFLWLGTLTVFFVFGGLILFGIPGVVFSLWFYFSNMILIDQNIKGMKALSLSKEYVRGNFWDVVWRLIFLMIVIVAIYLVIGIITGLATYIITSLDIFSKAHVGRVMEIISSMISFILMPLWTIYLFHFYKNIKSVKSDVTIPEKNNLGKITLTAIIGWIIIAGLIMIGTIGIFKIFPKQTFSDNLDVLTVQIPLTLFQSENGKYPSSLEELTPKYVENLPKTFQDSKNFIYEPGRDGKSYKLCLIKEGKQENCVIK